MNEEEFRRAYARIVERVKASEELKATTKNALLMSANRGPEAMHAFNGRKCGLQQKPSCVQRGLDAKRRRMPKWRGALAACLLFLAGMGLLLGTGSFGRIGAAMSENSFALAAYADENPDGAKGPVGLDFDKFYPTRSSAGYLYNAESDSVDYSLVTVSRYYVFDMTLAGHNIESVSYSLDGEGMSYGSWKGGQADRGPADEDSTTSFSVAFDDARSVVREIGLNYILDKDEKARFDQLYSSQDQNGIEAFLASCDAKRLAKASIVARATFFDGSSQTKTYGFKPVEGSETMYQTYLSQLSAAHTPKDWTSLAGEPSLFDLVEKSH